MQSILVGVDGSPAGDAARDLGLRWARRCDALLVGLGVVDQPSITRPESVPLGGGAFGGHRDEVRLTRARRQVEEFLQRFALRAGEAGVAHKLLEETGSPLEVLTREAQRFDLVVLGRQTHFHFATQQGPDDVLAKLLKNPPRPVVAVPETPVPESSTAVVAYDGSLQAARALFALRASGLADGAEVHIVAVGSDHVEVGRHADRAVDFLLFHDVRATRHVVSPEPSVAEALLHQAAAVDAGLLVMGCYGQPALRELFLGSVTATLLKQSPLPLFLYQ